MKIATYFDTGTRGARHNRVTTVGEMSEKSSGVPTCALLYFSKYDCTHFIYLVGLQPGSADQRVRRSRRPVLEGIGVVELQKYDRIARVILARKWLGVRETIRYVSRS